MHCTVALRNLRDGQGGIVDPRNAMNKNDARPQLEGNTTLSDLCLEERLLLLHGGEPEGCDKLPIGFHEVGRRARHVENPPSASLPRSKSKAMATIERLSSLTMVLNFSRSG